MAWKIIATTQVRDWYRGLPHSQQRQVRGAVRVLSRHGPALRRPLVGRIETSQYHNLKELRLGGTAKHVRILFVFDPTRRAIRLIGGDKAGTRARWYRVAIPQADALYAAYVEGRLATHDDIWTDGTIEGPRP